MTCELAKVLKAKLETHPPFLHPGLALEGNSGGGLKMQMEGELAPTAEKDPTR